MNRPSSARTLIPDLQRDQGDHHLAQGLGTSRVAVQWRSCTGVDDQSRGAMYVDKHLANNGLATSERKVLCSVPDLAAMLSIGRTAAWELVRSREIRSVKIGRQRRGHGGCSSSRAIRT
jgi:hypothetical protein